MAFSDETSGHGAEPLHGRAAEISDKMSGMATDATSGLADSPLASRLGARLRRARDELDAGLVIAGTLAADALVALGGASREPALRREVAAWKALRGLVGPDARAPEEVPDALLARLAFAARVSVLATSRAPALGPLLKARVAAAERQTALLELVCAQVGVTLGALGDDATCLLKGSAAIAHVYPRPAERERRDLDLLVAPAAFREVRARLWNAGWRDDPTRDGPGPPFSGRTHGMLRRFGAVTVSLDLHRDLVDRGWCGLRGEAFQRAFLADAARGIAPLPVSSPVDTALHTLAHLAAGGFRPTLGPWVDLVRLLPGIAPEALAERAGRYRLRGAAWLGVVTVERWFACDLARARAAVRPGETRARLLALAYGGEGGDLMTQPVTELRAVHAARALLRDPG